MIPNPKVVFIVVLSLAGSLFCGMLATYLLILARVDAALIAIMSGFTGTALGGLLSILNRTGGTSEQPLEVKQVNTPQDPAETHNNP